MTNSGAPAPNRRSIWRPAGYFSSLRTTLILLVVVALLPSFGLTLYTAAEHRLDLERKAQAGALAVAHAASLGQQRFVQSAGHLLIALAKLPEIRAQSSNRCNEMLAALMAHSQSYVNLFAADADGNVYCHGVELPHHTNVAQDAWFQAVLQTGQLTLGEFQVSRASHEAEVHLAYPIRDDAGRIQGVVTAGLDLAHLSQLLEETATQDGTSLSVVDRRGTILAHYPDPQRWVGQSAREAAIVQTVLLSHHGVAEAADMDGVQRLFAFTPLAGTPQAGDAYVIVGIPAETAFAEANRQLATGLLALGLAALATLFIAGAMAHWFVLGPVGALTSASARLAAGDLSARAGWVKGRGEISQLAQSFNRMAENLERRREELSESQARLQDFLDHAHDLIHILAPDGRFLYVNSAWHQTLEYSAEELAGLVLFDIIAPEHREACREHFQTLLAGQAYSHTEMRLISKNGRRIEVEGRASLRLQDGQPAAIRSILRDVTDRRLAEADLRDSEERYRRLVELSPDAIMVHSEGVFTFANPAAVRMLGAQCADQLIGRPVLSVVHPDYHALVEERLRVQLEEGRSVPPVEEKLIRLDGQMVDVEVSAIPYARHEKPAFQVVARDITERKQAQASVIQAASRAEALARVAARLNAQLNLDAVLQAVCEETARALNAPAAAAVLYDERDDCLRLASDCGLPPSYRARHAPVPRAIFEAHARSEASVGVVPDVQKLPDLPNAALHAELDVRTLAGAAMLREQRLVGALFVYALTQVRHYGAEELALLRGLADQAAQAISNARLFERTQRHLKHVEALRHIDKAIMASLDIRLTLNVILEEVAAQLRVDAADVLLLESNSQTLVYAASRGFRSEALRYTLLRVGEGHAGQAALERRLVSIPDLGQREDCFVRSPHIKSEAFRTYHGMPLIAKGVVKGVLETFHRHPFAPDEEWLSFLEDLAGQAAIAIDNAGMFQEVQRSNVELIVAYDSTLEGWSKALELRDKETEGHTQRVTEMTLRLARAMGLSDAELVHMRRGALLHDIGKVAIPDGILHKPGPLNDDEWAVMRRHPAYAHEMLAPIAYLRQALDIPHYHHERWNGSGYPHGLKGHEIPLAARIFSVADVWDALGSDRPYRAAWPAEAVREYIAAQAGQLFDPEVVAAFLQLEPELAAKV